MCKVSGRKCIGVGDIYPNDQIFPIFYQFEQTKMAMGQPLWIWSRLNFTEFKGGL